MTAATRGADAVSTLLSVGEKLLFLRNEFHTHWPGSSSDIQRTYNGKRGTKKGDFVEAFRPGASFLYGAACAAVGVPKWAFWQGEEGRM